MVFKNSIQKLLVVICCHLISIVTFAQESTEPLEKKVFKINVVASQIYKQHYLYEVADTTITISAYPLAYSSNVGNNTSLRTINYNSINTVTAIRKGSVTIGALAGTLTGVLIGLASYHKPQQSGFVVIDLGPGPAALAGGFLGALTGTVVGLIVHNKKYYIGRDLNKFGLFRKKIVRKLNPIQDL